MLLGCMPFLAAMGGVIAKMVAAGNTKAQEAYTEVRGREFRAQPHPPPARSRAAAGARMC